MLVIGVFLSFAPSIKVWGRCFWWRMERTQSYIMQAFFSPSSLIFNAIKLLKYQIIAVSFLGWSQKSWTPYYSDGEILKHEAFLELDAISTSSPRLQWADKEKSKEETIWIFCTQVFFLSIKDSLSLQWKM